MWRTAPSDDSIVITLKRAERHVLAAMCVSEGECKLRFAHMFTISRLATVYIRPVKKWLPRGSYGTQSSVTRIRNDTQCCSLKSLNTTLELVLGNSLWWSNWQNGHENTRTGLCHSRWFERISHQVYQPAARRLESQISGIPYTIRIRFAKLLLLRFTPVCLLFWFSKVYCKQTPKVLILFLKKGKMGGKRVFF